ncbi:MAG: tetratricopeptide repeat protein [Candidatus Eisenbacteria bacterium]|nr:tetratricopeptide repeat protein [Candidatus Eisenbacteria bacterium]
MKAILKSIVAVIAFSLAATGTLILSGCGQNPHLSGGRLYLSQKIYPKAVRELELAVQEEPKNGLAHLELARAYAELDSTKKAGLHFDEAAQVEPKRKKDSDINRKHYAILHFNEGLRLSQQEQKFDEAAVEFEKAIDLDASDAGTYMNLGFAYGQIGRREDAHAAYEKAIVLYEKVIQLNAADPIAYKNLGLAYAQLGRHDEASAMFEKAAALAPTDEKVKKNLATVYIERGNDNFKKENYAEAIKSYEKALGLGSDSVNVMFQLGNCYFQQAAAETSAATANALFEKSGSFYENVLRKSPDDIDAMTNLGMVEFRLDRMAEAIQLLRNVEERDPKAHEVHKILGGAYARTGEKEMAVTEIVFSKALDPNRGKRTSDLDSWLSPDGLKARYGDTSEVAKVIQERGVPQEVYVYEESGSLVETWFYWSQGKAMYFVNGRIPPKSEFTFFPIVEK